LMLEEKKSLYLYTIPVFIEVLLNSWSSSSPP